jgi:HSP20 family protein
MPRADTLPVQAPERRSVSPFTGSLFEPLTRLRSEVDRLFDGLPARWPSLDFAALAPAMPVPAVEMKETARTYRLTVEVPGIDPEDIEVHVEGEMIVISGEKNEEREEQDENYLYSERSYGAFERRLEVPPGADAGKIKAHVRKGVLQISLPKSGKTANNKRRIAIDAA